MITSRYAELLVFRKAFVFSVRAEGQVAQDAAASVPPEIEDQRVVIDSLVGGERG